MSGTVETITVGAEGLTVSLIVWRRFRRPAPGVVEQILALNPGLAELGATLPLGTQIRLPSPGSARRSSPRTVRLW